MSESNGDSGIRFEDDPDAGDEGEELLFIGEAEAVPEVPCWRCGKGVAAGRSACPYCHAALGPPGPLLDVGSRRRSPVGQPAVVTLLWYYLGILLLTVALGTLVRLSVDPETLKKPGGRESLLVWVLALEVVETALVVAACVSIRPPASPWWYGPGRAALAWLGGVPLTALLLGVNFGYHALVRGFLGVDGADEDAIKTLSVLLIVAHCVIPAIVEELFFRYVALGQLRSLMGVHGAILVTSVMFGMAHIAVPGSIPILTVVGLGLGYARVSGGGLLLPIAIHFLHNLAVTWYETLT